MQVRTLGTFEVDRDGLVVTPSAPKLRRVFALLALHSNNLVHTPQLVEELWEDHPPLSCSTTLQTYIYQLRKLFGLAEEDPSSAECLRTRPNGYLLCLPADALDLRRFEDLSARGTDEMRRGHVEAAASSLRAALDLWRGPALSDVTVGPVLQADILHLEERRNCALELRLDADLMLGRHHQLISELTGQIARNPTHESLHSRLMLALYRAGRPAESLQVFHRVRATLAKELGLEPGPHLQKMHRAVLSADPSLEEYGGAAVTTSTPFRTVDPPAQLPSRVPLVGRDADVAALAQLLLHPADGNSRVVTVVGPPGIGSSTFCVAAGHQARTAFPDGQFYHRFGPASDPGQVLGGFLQAIGVPSTGIPDSPEERGAMFRSWTAHRRVLVVLDNVTGSGNIAPLLPTGPGCATLVASHRLLSDQSINNVIALPPLSAEHSLELLCHVVGRSRIERDPESAHALVAICGGLPLVLRAAATKLALRPHWRVVHLLNRIGGDARQLPELATDDLDFRRSVLSRYRLLSADYQEAFHRIAGHISGAATVDEVAELLHVDGHSAETVLEHLVEFQLAEVTEVGPTAGAATFRYRVHPLVRLAVTALEPPRDHRPQLTSIGGSWNQGHRTHEQPSELATRQRTA